MPNWVNPVDIEEASLPAHIHTIQAHAQLGAPEPPIDSLAREYKTGGANETDISPAKAREHTRWMRMRVATLRLHARRQEQKRCKRGHLMTPENTYKGRKGRGDQCRECHNASRRKVA